MPPYQLRQQCNVNDGDGIGTCNATAFWGETWWRLLWPGKTVNELVESVAARAPYNLLQARDVRRIQIVVDAGSGAIVGYARWILPKSLAGEWLEAQVPDVDASTREKLKKQYEGAEFNSRGDMDSLDDHIMDWRNKYLPENSLQLDYLAVHPDHHRQGVATMLVHSGVEVATRLALNIYLVAMGKKASSMYLRAGFELLEERSQDLTPYGEQDVYETYYMVRRTSSAPDIP